MVRNTSILTIAGMLAIATSHSPTAQAAESVGLSFDLDPVGESQSALLWSPLEQNAPPQAKTQVPPKVSSSPNSLEKSGTNLPEQWWTQGSDSPLAVAIGSAEGTRTPDGSKTPAYYWHSDPGNGADNFGTFSYQHLPDAEKQSVSQAPSTTEKRQVAAEKSLPELADQRQLQKLKSFQEILQQQAKAKGLKLNELELINGLDLANQSEAAALSEYGYIDRLAQMKQLVPEDPTEQIKEARTWSFWCPDKHAWDAPGLGNDYDSIRQDQTRRLEAIQQAIAQYNSKPEQTMAQKSEQPAPLSTETPKRNSELQTFEEFQREVLDPFEAQHPNTAQNEAKVAIPNPDLFKELQKEPGAYRQTAMTPLTEQQADAIIFHEPRTAQGSGASSWI